MSIERFLRRPFFFLLLLVIFYTVFFAGPKSSGRKERFESSVQAAGKIEEEPAFGEKTTSFLLSSDKLAIGGKNIPGKHRLKVYVKGHIRISYADAVMIKGIYSRGITASNPGQFDLEEYLAGKNIIGTIYVSSPDDIKILGHGRGSRFILAAIILKNRIVSKFRDMMPEKQAVMFGSILFGTKASPVPQETVEAYRKSGVVHILVASGNRVSILLGICLALRRMLNLAPWFSTCLASFLIWGFTAMAGFGPSIVRASVMGQITLLGGLLDRDADF